MDKSRTWVRMPTMFPGPRMPGVVLPEYIQMCEHCKGTGLDPAKFQACLICRNVDVSGNQGVGYVYIATGKPITDSVMHQLNVMQGEMRNIVDQLEGVPAVIVEKTVHHYGDNIMARDITYDDAFAKILEEWDDLV